ncbi:Ring/U-Box superfamily protein [Klebsormidium nitens]|uniref:Ring/U-Box superfamily protein n=1 Tax=Klebsormidium nitens TaxID=105231 RepID=A0A1Y1HSX1_KLENI|nr:Ring/U-Box superfamily protein [Klebsormidium nitens]|eukprot:GAQ78928.1 Ring/U-Box superfamily protein [Klebsormidium nitens]
MEEGRCQLPPRAPESMPGTAVSISQEGRCQRKPEGPSEIEEAGAASMDATSSGDDVSILHEQEEGCDGDERLAAILQLQLVQQKQEMMAIEEARAVTNADALFRRGLEALIGDHLTACMEAAAGETFGHRFRFQGDGSASAVERGNHDEIEFENNEAEQACQSDGGVGAGQNEKSVVGIDKGNQAASERNEGCDVKASSEERSSDPGGADVYEIGESSGVITDEDEGEQGGLLRRRRPRDSHDCDTMSQVPELVALSRMQAVSSMLGASFLRDEPAASTSRRDLDFEPYMQRAHLEALQRWREMELHRHLETEELRSRAPRRGVVRRQPDATDVNSNGDGNRDDVYQESSQMERDGGTGDSEGQDGTEVAVGSEGGLDANNGMGAEEGSNLSAGGPETSIPLEQTVTREASFDQIANSSNAAPSTAEPRQQPQTQNLVQITPLNPPQTPPNPPQARIQVSVSELVRLRESARSRTEATQRERQMVRHRAAQRDRFLDLEAAERERELAGLGQQRAVSAFAHRTRLQSLFHGRSSHQNPAAPDAPPLSHTPRARVEEMGSLRARRPVSGIRELFRHNLENIVRRQAAGERLNTNPRVNQGSGGNQGVVANGNQGFGANQGAAPRVNGVAGHNQGVAARVIQELGANQGAGIGLAGGLRSGVRAGRAPQERWVDEASAYNLELQELLTRRNVSTILTSEFRNRLEDLVNSLVLTRVGTTAHRPVNQGVPRQAIAAPQAPPAAAPPAPPPLPQAPLWQPAQMAVAAAPARWHAGNGGSSHDLRESVRELRQEMEQMRGLMENCFEMQLELQRSIRQEVAGALSRVHDAGRGIPQEPLDGATWATVRRGVCCVCCESGIDALLYRCGHMCACHSCARQLQQSTGKCPLCRAPILEVVRAFTTA